jgi:hypothetical protein
MKELVDKVVPMSELPTGEYDDTAYWLSGKLREHSNYTLGSVLTSVEAALGDSKQAEALKAIIRKEIYALMERNQAEVYVRAKMQKVGVESAEIHFVDDGVGEYGDSYTKRNVEEEK